MAKKGKVENQVWLKKGNEIIATFAYSDKEGEKMPSRAADMFLRGILEDKNHKYHQDLLDGKIERMPGHPEVVQPKMEYSL